VFSRKAQGLLCCESHRSIHLGSKFGAKARPPFFVPKSCDVVTYEHPTSTTPAIRTAQPSNLLRLMARPAATSPTIIDISRAGATKAQWRARAERAQRQNI
jgi:hypothetical protein